MGIFNPHPGSWFGLPDYGITETIGGLFGSPRTSQGGSNILGRGSTPSPTASVLGSQSTYDPYAGTQSTWAPTSTYTPTISGGGGGAPAQAPTGDGGGQPSGPSPWDLLQQNWGSYISDLDNVLNNLSGQKESLAGTVESQKKAASAELGQQYEKGKQSLEKEKKETKEQQAKSLKDIGASVSQALKAGNIYLGGMGVTSPSAMNQYSYALSKLGTRERSNVMQNAADIQNEINVRGENLQNLYNTEQTKLNSWADEQLNSISQWYYSAVNQIQQQKSQDRQALSQQILDQALNWLNSVQQYSFNKRQALDQWAMNNAQNLEQLKAQLNQVSSPDFNYYQPGNISGIPTVGAGSASPSLFGFGTPTDEDQNKLFGSA